MKAPQPAIRLSRDDVVRDIPVPGVFLPPPQIRNAALIPKQIEQKLRPIWSQGWFPPATLRLTLLEDVVVAGEGLVFTRKLRLVTETASRHTHASIAAARASVESRLAANALDRLTGTTLLCRQAGASNHQIWLTGLLPQAWLAAQYWPHQQRILLPRAPEPWRGMFLSTLAHLGAGPEKCLECGTEPVLVDKLLLIDGLLSPSGLVCPLVNDCLAALSDRIAASRPQRLCVASFTPPAQQSISERRLLHEAHHAGFAVINPASVPFDNLAAAFKAATRVIGMNSPAMVNLAFCKPDADIIILTEANDPATANWSLAGLAGLRMLDIRIPPAGLPEQAERTAMFEPTLPQNFMHPSRTRREIETTLHRFFDPAFYQAQAGGAKLADPLTDFLTHGWQKPIEPSPSFSASKYRAAYPDVMASQMNPLMHYAIYGENEGRTIFPVA